MSGQEHDIDPIAESVVFAAPSRIILEIVRHHTVFAEGHTSTSSQSKKPPDFSGALFRNVSMVPKKKKVTCNGKGETLQLILSTTGRKAR